MPPSLQRHILEQGGSRSTLLLNQRPPRQVVAAVVHQRRGKHNTLLVTDQLTMPQSTCLKGKNNRLLHLRQMFHSKLKRCTSIREKESTMICWGGPFKIGAKEWLATSTTSRGVVNVTNLQRILEFPPKHSISTSNLLIHAF